MDITKNLSLRLKNDLPQTYKILKSGNLLIDHRIKALFLSGSRGLANSFNTDSDIDITMILDTELLKNPKNHEEELKQIIKYTLDNWEHEVALDIAVIYDNNNCKLRCFLENNINICKNKKIDCFGLFKIQKGFNGFVPKMGINAEKVFPIVVIWSR